MVTEWSTLRLSEAMDMLEEFVNQANESLEQAKIVAAEARKIANMPEYLDEHLVCLLTEIKRIDGLKDAIKCVWDHLPEKWQGQKEREPRWAVR